MKNVDSKNIIPNTSSEQNRSKLILFFNLIEDIPLCFNTHKKQLVYSVKHTTTVYDFDLCLTVHHQCR